MRSSKQSMHGLIFLSLLLGSSLATTTWADGRYPQGSRIERDARPLPARHHQYEPQQKYNKHPRDGGVKPHGAHRHHRHQQHPGPGPKIRVGQRPQIWITLPWLVIH